MRNLQKSIQKLVRKAALKIVRDGSETEVNVTPDNLKDFMGHPLYRR